MNINFLTLSTAFLGQMNLLGEWKCRGGYCCQWQVFVDGAVVANRPQGLARVSDGANPAKIGPGSEEATGIQVMKRLIKIRFKPWIPAYAGVTILL